MVIGELRGLTLQECLEREEEIPGAGDRVGGIGFVRVHKSQNIMWTMVAANDLVPRFCPDHGDTEMALRRTDRITVHNMFTGF